MISVLVKVFLEMWLQGENILNVNPYGNVLQFAGRKEIEVAAVTGQPDRELQNCGEPYFSLTADMVGSVKF
jgi:hypothetical protein